MRNLSAGLRQSLRGLLHTPAFTISAVLTVALGMAGTTIIFSTYYHVIMRPLPYDEWEQLMVVMNERDEGRLRVSPSADLLVAARAASVSFDALEVWADVEQPLLGAGDPVMLPGAQMTAGLPSMLRVSPLLGRTFTDQEAAEGAALVVLGERVWRRYFDADRSVIGSTVQLGPDSRTVIGIMPANFSRYHTFGRAHDYWTPLELATAPRGVSALARVRAGVATEAAAAELDVLAAGLADGNPIAGPGWTVGVRPLTELSGTGMNARNVLPRLFGAAALLLLIACANVAGLLLVRLHARGRELAVRSALGAHRLRLLGELLREQLLLSAAAATVAILLAVWGLDLISALRPERLASLDNVTVNAPIMLFAVGLVLLTTLLFGALPAVALLRRDLLPTLQIAAGPRLTSGTRSRAVLVTLQLALSTVLLVGGFLLVRTVHELERADLGFEPDDMLVAQLSMPEYRYTTESREALLKDLLASVHAVPGVRGAAVTTGAPPRIGLIFVQSLEVDGSDVSTEGVTYLRGAGVSPGFFNTIGARVIEGREFQEGDDAAAVVTRAFVDRFWPGERGVGRRFRTSPTQDWQTIVGVIENVRDEGATHTLEEMKTFWAMSYGSPSADIVIRTAGDPLAVAPAFRQILARLDADVPIRELESMSNRMAGTIAVQRFNMFMLSVFAATAVLLCAIGLYGLLAYSLQQRVREIGVRIALGASPARVRTLFMRQAARLVAAGLAIGVLTAAGATRALESMVHGVSPRDPVSFGAAIVVVIIIVLPASWLPARRAARVEALEALRQD